MPLSSYAQTALKSAAAPVASGGARPLSSYAQATLKGTSVAAPDAQNYQSAFAAPVAFTPSNPIVSDLSDVGSAVLGQNITPTARIPVTPQSYLTDIYGTPTNTGGNIGIQGGIVGDTLNAWTKTITQLNTAEVQPTVGGRVAGATQAGLDALGAFFQPVSTVFTEAATVPGVVGDIAGYINNIFSKVGNVGGDTLAAYVQAGPFTDSQKNTLVPLAQQLGTLGAQIVLGKAGEDTFSALKDTTHSFINTLSEDSRIKELNTNPSVRAAISKQTSGPSEPTSIPVQSSGEETQVPTKIPTIEKPLPPAFKPIVLPEASEEDYAKAQGYEPIVPDNQLPVIKMGPKATSELPTIKANAPASNDLGGGMKLVPEKPPTQIESQKSPTLPKPKGIQKAPVVQEAPAPIESKIESAPTAEIPKSVPSPYIPTAPIERPVAEDGTKVAKSANDINQTIVNEGLAKLSPYQMSTFTSGSYKDSAAQGDILKNTDPDALMKMAQTGKGIPEGVHPQILYNIAEAHAEELFKQTKDPTQLMELAKSPLTKQLSEAGSTMGSHGYNDNPNSSTKALQEAAEAKSGGVKGKVKTDAVVKEATATISKTRAKLINYESILDAITC